MNEVSDQNSENVLEDSKSSSDNVQEFHPHMTKWTKDHLIHQVIGYPSLPVQTRASTSN